MDWARAIDINRTALTRIVAALIAMVGLSAAARLPRAVHRAALRLLRPAESAVRRLIVIAARGVVVKPAALRPMPAGLALAGHGGARASFQLFDPRKRFVASGPAAPGQNPSPAFSSSASAVPCRFFSRSRRAMPSRSTMAW